MPRRRGGLIDFVSDSKSLAGLGYAFLAIGKATTDQERLEATANFLDKLAAATEGETDDLLAKHFRASMSQPESRPFLLHVIDSILKPEN